MKNCLNLSLSMWNLNGQQTCLWWSHASGTWKEKEKWRKAPKLHPKVSTKSKRDEKQWNYKFGHGEPLFLLLTFFLSRPSFIYLVTYRDATGKGNKQHGNHPSCIQLHIMHPFLGHFQRGTMFLTGEQCFDLGTSAVKLHIYMLVLGVMTYLESVLVAMLMKCGYGGWSYWVSDQLYFNIFYRRI